MSVLQNSLGGIFDHIADVIEGGNSYAAGTAQKGIAGTRTHDPDADGISVVVEAGSSTTSVKWTNTWATDRWVKTTAAPWFLLLTSGDARNVGAARKITSWSATAVGVGVAFPVAPTVADTGVIREGFRRIRNDVDLENENQDGLDRSFHLRALPGKRWQRSGNAIEFYETTLELRLRTLTRARAHEAEASAMENLSIIRSIITRHDARDNTYMQLLGGEEDQAEVVKRDATKIVALDKYRLVYRIDSAYV